MAVATIALVSLFRDSGPASTPTGLDAIRQAALAVTEAPALVPAPAAPRPKWIWTSGAPTPSEQCIVERRIAWKGPLSRAVLRLSADNRAEVSLDGAAIATADEWQRCTTVDLRSKLGDRARNAGDALVTIDAHNEGGPAGVAAFLELVEESGDKRTIVTDDSWSVVDGAAGTKPATVIASLGDPPWGDIAGLCGETIDRRIAVPEGFVAELVYAVPRTQGSWVSLAVDGRGRLITSDQVGGLYRITPMPIGADAGATTVEPIDSPVGAAHGLAVVDGDLYCVVAGPRASGEGVYRLRDTDGDDRFDETTLLRRIRGEGEHGPHGIVAGPDGLLYIVGGNHTKTPDPERSLPPRIWGEDNLLPRLWDANGHAVGILAPGGWVCRMDREGTTFELVAIGLRNSYDLAFDRDGELFTYDSDMEWDMGAPWYRPTRLCHVVSGAEFGWRSGTANWPAYYPDSLPATLDLGPGSPTGLVFGYDTSFPAPWRDALFALDWTFGTVHALDLKRKGATFEATSRPFLTGSPLPVADAVANAHDGALYFVVGGRGAASAVYRVRWVGGAGASRIASKTEASTAERPARRNDALEARRAMEALHRPDAPANAIEAIWPLLDHADRFVRFAARTALEHQPIDRWIDRLWNEPSPARRVAAVIAAARCGATSSRERLHDLLDGIDWSTLDVAARLDLLRARALCLIRLGRPSDERCRAIAAAAEPNFPSGDDFVDRELCDLLVSLDSPVVVARALALMERPDEGAPEPIDRELLGRNTTYAGAILQMAAHQPQRQQVHFALSLRNAKRGWTPALRSRYFAWFDSAKRTSGGLSFAGFLDNIRADALAQLPEPERKRFASTAPPMPATGAAPPMPVGPGRAWTIDEVAALCGDGLRGRDLENGRKMFAAAMCIECHRLAGTGRLVGPDLSSVAGRFGPREIAEAIVEPSRVVSDQYRFTELRLRDDRVIVGRIVARSDGEVRVVENMLDPDASQAIAASEIVSEAPSLVSPMMPHLIDRMNPDEVRDLLAYLLAGGDPRSPLFAGKQRQ